MIEEQLQRRYDSVSSEKPTVDINLPEHVREAICDSWYSELDNLSSQIIEVKAKIESLQDLSSAEAAALELKASEAEAKARKLQSNKSKAGSQQEISRLKQQGKSFSAKAKSKKNEFQRGVRAFQAEISARDLAYSRKDMSDAIEDALNQYHHGGKNMAKDYGDDPGSAKPTRLRLWTDSDAFNYGTGITRADQKPCLLQSLIDYDVSEAVEAQHLRYAFKYLLNFSGKFLRNGRNGNDCYYASVKTIEQWGSFLSGGDGTVVLQLGAVIRNPFIGNIFTQYRVNVDYYESYLEEVESALPLDPAGTMALCMHCWIWMSPTGGLSPASQWVLRRLERLRLLNATSLAATGFDYDTYIALENEARHEWDTMSRLCYAATMQTTNKPRVEGRVLDYTDHVSRFMGNLFCSTGTVNMPCVRRFNLKDKDLIVNEKKRTGHFFGALVARFSATGRSGAIRRVGKAAVATYTSIYKECDVWYKSIFSKCNAGGLINRTPKDSIHAERMYQASLVMGLNDFMAMKVSPTLEPAPLGSWARQVEDAILFGELDDEISDDWKTTMPEQVAQYQKNSEKKATTEHYKSELDNIHRVLKNAQKREAELVDQLTVSMALSNRKKGKDKVKQHVN
jgi:hypothetical protein